MSGYQPFLLEHLAEAKAEAAGNRRPESPIEEEALIRHMTGNAPGVWERLQREIKASLGMPLLLELPSGSRVSRSTRCGDARSPWRGLILQGAQQGWFVIEHPVGLELAERQAGPGEIPALARPSLFAEWWRLTGLDGSAMDSTGHILVGEAPHGVLGEHIEGLLENGQASDWHLEPRRDHYLSRLRIDGSLAQTAVLSRDKGTWLIHAISAESGLGQAATGQPREGRLEHHCRNGTRIALRLSLVPSLYGAALAARFVYPADTRSFHIGSLGLEPGERDGLLDQYREGNGLWLLAGPTGAGKSTTLHAFLRLSVSLGEKVLAIEDPVEALVEGVQQMNVGSPPSLTYPLALRAFLRQAPDCVLIGEIRDEETAAVAVQAARTGHRVLSTVHARDNPGILQRFADLGQEAHAVASVCAVALHQRLVPLLCRTCRKKVPLPPEWSRILSEIQPYPRETCFVANGCEACRHGSSGRRAIFAGGEISDAQPVPDSLLANVFTLFQAGTVPFEALFPFMPAAARNRFSSLPCVRNLLKPASEPKADLASIRTPSTSEA